MAKGTRIKNPKTLSRIRSLAIPPAWKDVWICPDELGHLQATGRDAKGRKQYRYHPRFRSRRDETKFARLIDFARRLPLLRRRIQRDLRSPTLDGNKVLAVVTRLLETTCIRVGNTEYAKQNGSFGLTTLRDKHARTQGSRLTLCFPGKSGIAHQVEIDDPRLAKAVRRCRDLPGYELFQYVDETGTHRKVDSSMVNDYLRETMGDEFTAKDFRTWQGTLEAAIVMSAIPRPKTETAMQKAISGAIRDVAERLGNRPATCRKFYIHPAIVDAFEKGSLPLNLKRSTRTVPSRGLSKVERTVIKLLR